MLTRAIKVISPGGGTCLCKDNPTPNNHGGTRMNHYLDAAHFPTASEQERQKLSNALADIIATDLQRGTLPMLGSYRKILGDNRRREEWETIHQKLLTLFKCGRSTTLNGPMIGVSMSIRDSDYFQRLARQHGEDRSMLAKIEWMATLWNVTYASTGLWMGKTFEPVTKSVFSSKCGNDPTMMAAFDPATARIGRNFFRDPDNPNFIQSLGLPVLTPLWNLRDRPRDSKAPGFDSQLLPENLAKEKAIAYRKTGGIFLSLPGESVVPELNGMAVYQLNYRWHPLHPAFPMTRLIDELVQIDEGIWLGQLVMATQHYSLGTLQLPFFGEDAPEWELGDAYTGDMTVDYGYQNNGFFLMVDTSRAREAFADNAFPNLRPRPGESGWKELGYDQQTPATTGGTSADRVDWAMGWRDDPTLNRKFTTFCLEQSPKGETDDFAELLRPGESILQMLQRQQGMIAAASSFDDHLRHFEVLNRLFRRGIAPRVVDGVFQGQGQGYNSRFDAPEPRQWYGADDPCTGFDYYHGATLNLHWGFGDSFVANIARKLEEFNMIPASLALQLQANPHAPNLLDAVWATIGRFIFPWAGKSFERIGGRKLSMLLDESDDLAQRYPERVAALKSHPASFPHYDLVRKNRDHFWQTPGIHAEHLKSGSWDQGMSKADKAFWEREASDHWVFGNNIQDARILATDPLFRVLDMNYQPPLPSIQQLADAGPSPFVRQGYVFLGAADQDSILPMNNGTNQTKKVFQFHYRYPMIGGPAPIGTCLDELVEIAEGLFLGQLIYATSLLTPFHSSTDPAQYQYQLFGYFLLLDNTWEQHRQAIGFDINT